MIDRGRGVKDMVITMDDIGIIVVVLVFVFLVALSMADACLLQQLTVERETSWMEVS